MIKQKTLQQTSFLEVYQALIIKRALFIIAYIIHSRKELSYVNFPANSIRGITKF
jgi:hypothetical protein